MGRSRKFRRRGEVGRSRCSHCLRSPACYARRVPTNVLGGELRCCCRNALTGFIETVTVDAVRVIPGGILFVRK